MGALDDLLQNPSGGSALDALMVEPKNKFMQKPEAFIGERLKNDPAMKAVKEYGPEAAGTALGAMASTGVGTVPAMAIQAGGAAVGEGVRQLMSDEELSPKDRAIKVGGAAVRGAAGPVINKAIEKGVAPAAKWIGDKVATGAEKLSGLSYDTPGVLKEAFNDPSLIFSQGIDAARKVYEKAKGVAGTMRPELENTLKKMDYIEKSIEIAKSGTMSPYEALEARKTLDSIEKKVAGPAFRATRELFDKIAKVAYEGADAAFSRAVKSNALTDFMPKNKTGTPSIGKMILGGVVPPAGFTMSPMAQGAAATALGAAAIPARAILSQPVAASGLSDAILQRLSKRQ